MLYSLSKYILVVLLCVQLDSNVLVSCNEQGWEDSLGLEPLHDFNPITSPRVALLVNFPKSGSTYVQNVMHRTTNLTTANNYGMTMIDGIQVNTRQVWLDRTNGPFRNNELSLPESGFILTKTHCGGWCYSCKPSNYLMSKTAFHRECLVSFRHNQYVLQKVQYDGKLVKKGIHLMRDPFSNIVSRFLRYSERKNDPDFDVNNPIAPSGFPMTIGGFQDYCKEMNDEMYGEEYDWVFKNPKVNEFMDKIPCRGEFLKYFKWHNFVRIALEEYQKCPYYIVHYFDFKDNFQEERDKMLNFLELPKVYTDDNYNFEYMIYYYFFSIEEVEYIEKFCQQICDPWLYEELKRYFIDAKNPDLRNNPNTIVKEKVFDHHP